jgi:hypothetical protein
MTAPTLSGFNVLLMGPSGSGKTHAIGTLVDTGMEVFYLDLENGLESLLGYYSDRDKPVPANLHWHKLTAPAASFEALQSTAEKINLMNLEALAKMNDPNRSQHNRFISLLSALHNFPDDRTGKTYGDASEWGTDRALIIDGMTGINDAAMSLVIGGKPVRNQADWQVAQDQVLRIIRMLTDDCRCHTVVLGHVERETDQVLGGVKLMVSSLGKALAPKMPALFSDVVLTVREGTSWYWDTASSMADLKTRNLPIAVKVTPDFAQILSRWQKRVEAASSPAGVALEDAIIQTRTPPAE